jgi:putative transposase
VGQDGILRADRRSAQTRGENLQAKRPLFTDDRFPARRLPHYHALDRPIFLTWRLHGSLPANRGFPSASTSGRAFLTMDRILDHACTGPLYLRQPEVATMVVEAIRYRQQCLGHYVIHAYVVMANHVHLLITPCVDVPRLMQSLKRFTAREANRMLGHTGQPFWQDESYDRIVRDETEFQRIVRYIEMNPVKARSVANPEEFPWSSGIQS